VSPNVPLAIRDFSRVVSTITISRDVTIRDLNVQVNASHTYDSDMRMTLVGPDGTRVNLVNRRGGSGDNFTGTTFDDEAGEGIWQGSAPFAGSYRPEYLLSAFDGKNARGTWAIVVEDVALFDGGRLNGWSMTLSGGSSTAAKSVPAASAPANLVSAPPVSRSGRIEWGAFVPFFM
jgi:subtilisin-like proprotein convertase family protein